MSLEKEFATEPCFGWYQSGNQSYIKNKDCFALKFIEAFRRFLKKSTITKIKTFE